MFLFAAPGGSFGHQLVNMVLPITIPAVSHNHQVIVGLPPSHFDHDPDRTISSQATLASFSADESPEEQTYAARRFHSDPVSIYEPGSDDVSHVMTGLSTPQSSDGKLGLAEQEGRAVLVRIPYVYPYYVQPAYYQPMSFYGGLAITMGGEPYSLPGVQEMMAGTAAGTVAGSVAGTLAGAAAGTAAGTLAGAIAGTVAGMASGSAASTVAGAVEGAVAGTAPGAASGTACGAVPYLGINPVDKLGAELTKDETHFFNNQTEENVSLMMAQSPPPYLAETLESSPVFQQDQLADVSSYDSESSFLDDQHLTSTPMPSSPPWSEGSEEPVPSHQIEKLEPVPVVQPVRPQPAKKEACKRAARRATIRLRLTQKEENTVSSTKAVKPARASKVTKRTKSAKAANLTKTANAAKLAKTTKAAQLEKTTRAAESTKATRAAQATKTTKTVKPTETTKAAQAAKSAKAAQATTTAKVAQAAKSTKAAESTTTTKPPGTSTKPTGTAKITKPTKQTTPVEPTKPVVATPLTPHHSGSELPEEVTNEAELFPDRFVGGSKEGASKRFNDCEGIFKQVIITNKKYQSRKEALLLASKELIEQSQKKLRGVQNCSATCDAMHATMAEMIQHLETQHDRTYRKFLCPFKDCPWSIAGFHQFIDARRHILALHRSPQFFCELPGCGKQFARRDSCTRHVKRCPNRYTR